MKNKKNLLLAALCFLAIIVTTGNKVNAATLTEDIPYGIPGYDNTQDKWTIGVNGKIDGVYEGARYSRMKLDENVVWCIESGRGTLIGTSNYNSIDLVEYFKSKGVDEQTSKTLTDNIGAIIHFGYGYDGDWSDEMEFATQALIWQTMANTVSIPNVNGIYDIHPDIQVKMDIISQRVENYKKNVSFDKEEVTIIGYGKENAVTLTDSSGVFSNYSEKLVEGIHVEKNGNELTIWAEKGDNAIVTIEYILDKGDYTSPKAWVSGTSQNAVQAGGIPSKTISLNVKLDIIPSADLAILKLSASELGKVTIYGDKISIEDMDVKLVSLVNIINSMTIENLMEYLTSETYKGLKGAKYGLFNDEECTKPLYMKNPTTKVVEKVESVTDDRGIIYIKNIPLGEYYLKEIEAPKSYGLSQEVIKIILGENENEELVYKVLIDFPTQGVGIQKKDAFTGEAIANCEFEIKDKETGEELFTAITDENGKAEMPVNLFKNDKVYTYREISAPDIPNVNGVKYVLDTMEHEFTAKIDEKGFWISDPLVVENKRPMSNVKIEKTDLVNGEKIPNCSFEIKSLETDYVVTGKTDKNGECKFDKIPCGIYTYREISAPQEYNIDTTPHEFTVNEENVLLQVTNEKVETGDIAVVVICMVALLSIAGIVFVIKKNKK